MKKMIMFLILPLALVACKDKANKNPIANVTEASKEKDLQKTWQTECQLRPIDAVVTGLMSGGQAAVKSMRVQYKFQGANVNRVSALYASADCAQEAYIFNESGEFKIDKSKKTNDGGVHIDMSFKKVLLTIKDDNGAKSANAGKLCGRSDWAPGNEVDVTAAAKDLTCYNIQVPRKNLNVYRIDNNILYLGASPAAASAKPSDRPATLNFGLKFTPQK